MTADTEEQEIVLCACERGTYPSPRYRSCYYCYLDRASQFLTCIFCGAWHSQDYASCFKCRAVSPERDDAGRALRQLVAWRDEYLCQNCGAGEGDETIDPISPPVVGLDGNLEPRRVHVSMQVDHIVPCKAGGLADEWNLRVLCSVCNRVKGASWFPGCRYEQVRTDLARRYWLTGTTYFTQIELTRFRAEVHAWRRTGTWDPQTWDDVGIDLPPRDDPTATPQEPQWQKKPHRRNQPIETPPSEQPEQQLDLLA